MAEINFKLSKKNFKLLIEHVYIANWVLTSTQVEEDKELSDFLDTILSMGKNYNIMDEIKYYDDIGIYGFTQEKEKEIVDKIDEYTDQTFWEDLVDKLSRRDAIKKHGNMVNFDPVERMKAIYPEEKKYDKEFEEYGIERLKIVK